jgi:hypothetical protein
MKIAKKKSYQKTSQDTPQVSPNSRVTIKDKRGNVATPLNKDVNAWLAKGWTLST